MAKEKKEEQKIPLENQPEQIIEVEVERLREFKGHPFKVTDDLEMESLKKSISKYGILTPLIVRPILDGVYEIVSGHRRKHAAESLGYRKVPVIIRCIKHDDAIIAMVDSNMYREHFRYSEKAFAYKMKNDAMKRKVGRPKKEDTVDPNIRGKKTVDIIGAEFGDNGKQVQRYLQVTKLIPELLDMLDEGKIAFNPAVHISSLKEKEQRQFMEGMIQLQTTPTVHQAQEIKRLSLRGEFTPAKMKTILCEKKTGEISSVAFTNEQLHKFFPRSYSPAKMKKEILEILNIWKENNGKF